MNSAPPHAVLWLLKRLGSSPKNRALAGDILEKGSQGLPKSWYWRQTLHAVCTGSLQEIRSFKAAAALAALTGWLCLIACYCAFNASRDFLPPFLQLSPSSGVAPVLAVAVAWSGSKTLTIFSFAMSGFLVAALNRSRQCAMVLAFLCSVILVDVSIMGVMAFTALAIQSAFVESTLLIFSSTALLSWLGILLGGLASAPPDLPSGEIPQIE
jgi:hypothetical protein